MRSLVPALAFITLLSGSIQPLAASAQETKEPGKITGRITVDGKPARDINVIATPSITDVSKIAESILNKPATLKATSDSEGRYTFEGVAAGKYRLAPFAPTLVSSSLDSGSDVTVTSGGKTEGIDFSLSQGGVITGRVTDGDGRPVILERISLKSADSTAPTANSIMSTLDAIGGKGRMYATDDRGIYRIFGLRPGRYLVSAGSETDVLSAMFRFRPKRAQTFYPGVTEESKAKQVQVNAGAEATGIDIQFSLSDKGFIASGRVIEAEKGTPIPKAMVAYSKVRPVPNKPDDDDSDDNGLRVAGVEGGVPGGITTTNDKGEFRFEAVSPGSYKLEVSPFGALTGEGTSEFYGDPVNFEVRSGNIDRIEVKLHRGASISGVAVVDNGDKDSGLQSFGRVMLSVSVLDSQTKSYSSGNSTIGTDGTFRIGGLKAGKATIRVFAMGEQEAALLRVERNGVEVQGGFDIQSNEQISGLRVVLTKANCVIKGHVTIDGGSLPSGGTLSVRARRLSGQTIDFNESNSQEVDSNGDFEIEDLAPGTYEVEVFTPIPGQEGMRTSSAKQTVNTSTGAPGFVTLVLNLRGKGKGQ
jgi:hypothetical protein